MRVIFYHTRNRGEAMVLDAFRKGLERHGTPCEPRDLLAFRPEEVRGADAVVAGRSLLPTRNVMNACAAAGVPFIYYDKGYFGRGWKTSDPGVYYRFSVNGFQPLDHFQALRRPADRWEKLGIRMRSRAKGGRNVVFAGCSSQFAAWNGFEPVAYAREVLGRIRGVTGRPVVYRPKPSDPSAAPLAGTIFSPATKKIEEELRDAWTVVTFSSNAAVDAVIAGVPAFVLGPGIARPVANTDLARLEDPWFPSDAERFQWACDLAYCQWRADEMESGRVWEHLKEVTELLERSCRS